MRSATETIACAICGGPVERELLRITQPDRFERHVGIAADGYSRSWVECESCGAVTNVQTDENRKQLATLAADYYEVDFANSSIGEKFLRVMGLPASQSDNAQRVARIHRFLGSWPVDAKRLRRVLDIGSGTGVFLARFLDEAPDQVWQAMAVEPDPIAVEHLKGLERFQVTPSLFSRELGFSDYDLITLNKVVEHLPDPIGLLEDAANALASPLGVIYVEVPDKLTISLRPATDNILGALHCHLYDPTSLTVLLSKAGLVPIRVERVFEPSGKISVTAFATRSEAVPQLADSRST